MPGSLECGFAGLVRCGDEVGKCKWDGGVELSGGDVAIAIEINGGRDASLLLKITRVWTIFDRTTKGNCKLCYIQAGIKLPC
jgi:hypothetical protein